MKKINRIRTTSLPPIPTPPNPCKSLILVSNTKKPHFGVQYKKASFWCPIHTQKASFWCPIQKSLILVSNTHKKPHFGVQYKKAKFWCPIQKSLILVSNTMSSLADSILHTVRQDHLNPAANKMLQWQSIYLWRPASVFDWCCQHPFLSGTWGNWLQTSFPWLISRTLRGYHASQRYTHTQSAQLWVVWQRIWQRKHTCISVSYTSVMSQNTMVHYCSQALN